ncbi:transcriptional regulator [Streptomyces davaonensis JCM 4913]|uniref:Transcriptional regulator n=2 Tax=Streptomyces davaonensis TaxID=348043 RepID=K4QX23_STRDJ|nr:transcriptional regulator [Streptomyces davaonensis JCM 4913]
MVKQEVARSVDAKPALRQRHTILPMTQEDGALDSLVRKRIRALRVAQGWSLEELATRANLSQSTLSRIENGQRRLALDQLVTLARALDTTLDQLVENAADDVVISPMIDGTHGLMRWPVKGDPGMSVMRQRMTEPPLDNPARMRAHPGREWLVVLSGTAILMLGNRRFRVETNQAAEFPTMMPHAIGAEGGPCEIMGIFDRDARRGHQRDIDDSGKADGFARSRDLP